MDDEDKPVGIVSALDLLKGADVCGGMTISAFSRHGPAELPVADLRPSIASLMALSLGRSDFHRSRQDCKGGLR